eukprot:SAG22_NODE_319_length_12493_cov_33.326475_8_plen_51_part_00
MCRSLPTSMGGEAAVTSKGHLDGLPTLVRPTALLGAAVDPCINGRIEQRR